MKYEVPEMEIIVMDNKDIITLSGLDDEGDEQSN